jgi:hypothetical protein
MNLQGITNNAWSHYLLKYAMKCEPSGSLNLDVHATRALGLQNLTDLQLKMVAAFVLTKPVSPSEAAMSLLEYPMIERDVPVLYVDSAPPKLRTRILRASKTILHPID